MSKEKLPKKNFKRKKVEEFVKGGVEIEDGHHKKKAETDQSTTHRMQIYISQEQRRWLREKAFTDETQMTKIIRALIDSAMNQSGE
jgi:hypothetical protein